MDADFRLAEWLVQPSAGMISRAGNSHHLEPKTMGVLACLATHGGAVVSKDELLRSVWSDAFVTEHVLTHVIWQLRQVLGDGLIKTIPRRGYRLDAVVEPVFPPISSLVVLPLANLSGDPDHEYLADGITEMLTTDLAQIHALRVISRTSAMQYKCAAKSSREIAAELNVEAIVEGTVLLVGDRVRITAQLIHAATDRHLWAGLYDGDVHDVLALQDQVARAVVAEIQVTLTPHERARLTRNRRVDPAAHEAYLKGRYCWNRASEDSVRRSVAYFEEAIARDPDYALPYTGLADVYATITSPIMAAIPPADGVARIRPAVLHALRLDEMLAEAHQVIGWLKLYYEWDWTGAEAAIQRAIELNPNYSHPYADLGILYGCLERHPQAISCLRRACELDPLSLLWNTLHGWSLILAGQPTEAVQQLRKTLLLDPGFWFTQEVLGLALLQLGEYPAAIDACKTAVQLSGGLPFPKGILGHAYGVAGRIADAQSAFQELQQLSVTRYVAPVLLAYILKGTGDNSAACAYLEEGLRIRDTAMIWMKVMWKDWSGDTRYQRLLARMQFPE